MYNVKKFCGYPSVCIPYTSLNTTRRDVLDVFEAIMGRGYVEHIDMVNKTNGRGKRYRCVFVHMKEWPDNETARRMRERLLNGEDIKLVYDDPWFWKCNVSRLPKKRRSSLEEKPWPRSKQHIKERIPWIRGNINQINLSM